MTKGLYIPVDMLFYADNVTVAGSLINYGTFYAEDGGSWSGVTFNGDTTGNFIRYPVELYLSYLYITGGGSWTLLSDLIVSDGIEISNGILNTDAFDLTSVGAVTLNGGDLTGGSGTMDLYSLTISNINSKFTGGSGTLALDQVGMVSGYLDIQAGEFIAPRFVNMTDCENYTRAEGAVTDWLTNTSTFTLNASSVDELPADTYYNLDITTSYAIILAGETTVKGYLTISSRDGLALSVGSNTLNVLGDVTINEGAILSVTEGDINIGGSWINNGTFSAGEGTVTFNGTSQQVLSGNLNFYDMIINSSAIVNIGSYNLAVSDSFLNYGTLQLNGDNASVTVPTNETGSTVEYLGTGINYSIQLWLYYNLTLGGSSTGVSIPDSITALHNLIINNINNITLNNNITLSGILTLISGKLNIAIAATGVNKVYDGTTDTMVTLSSYRIVGDIFDYSYTSALFSDKNVADGISVNVTGISIAGADAGNYTFNTTASTTANITPKELTVTGVTANNKAYDGTTAATLNTTSATLDGKISGDIVSLDAAHAVGTFATKDVGINIPVTVSGLAISGADMGNYTLTQPVGITANITAVPAPVPTPVNPNHATYENEAVFNNVTKQVTSVDAVQDARYEHVQAGINTIANTLQKIMVPYDVDSLKIVTNGDRVYIGY